MRGEMVGGRPMTPSERQKRSRSLRWLREQQRLAAEAEVLLDVFAGSDPERPFDTRIADTILAALAGTNESATRIVAAYLADLPTELAELRHHLDAIEQKFAKANAGGAHPR